MTFPVTLLIIGAVLLVIGLVEQLAVQQVAVKIAPNTRKASISIGSVLMIAACTLQVMSMPRAEAATAKTAPAQSQVPSAQRPRSFLDKLLGTPDSLGAVIRQQQDHYVRDSGGTEANQCFTNIDLADFKKDNVPSKIVAELRHDKNFLNIIAGIRALPPTSQQALFAATEMIAKPTWETQRTIDSDGQTVAGREAQLRIAEAVTSLARELTAPK